MIAYAGFAGFQSPLWATKELGLLTKYGINADLILTPGSTRQIQAMLGNSVHFAQVDAVTTINAIAQGADLVMISGSLNTFPFSFVAQKEIRKPEDLTGKKVGIVGFGGANELAVLLALKEWNMPRNAVTILQAGGAPQRYLGLVTKVLDATVLAQPEIGEAQRMGMNVLVHMRDMKTAAFPMNVMVVRRSFLQQNRDAGEALPAGLRRSDLSTAQQQGKSHGGAVQVAPAKKSQGDRRDLSVYRHQLRLPDAHRRPRHS